MARYHGRDPRIAVVNLSISTETLYILRQGARNSKSVGDFIDQLAFDYRARSEERAAKDADYAALLTLYGLPQKHHEVALEK